MTPAPRRRLALASLGLFLLATAWLATAALRHRFPGDVAITSALQSLVGADAQWTALVTATAKSPWKWILLGLSAVAGYALAGWRGLATALVTFALLGWLDGFLKALIARPRPSPELIAVTEQARGFSCPSSFGLTYISTIGFIGWIAALRAGRPWRWILPALAAITLLVGAAARILPGAHWASDVAASYLLGAAVIHPLVHGLLRPPAPEPEHPTGEVTPREPARESHPGNSA